MDPAGRRYEHRESPTQAPADDEPTQRATDPRLFPSGVRTDHAQEPGQRLCGTPITTRATPALARSGTLRTSAPRRQSWAVRYPSPSASGATGSTPRVCIPAVVGVVDLQQVCSPA